MLPQENAFEQLLLPQFKADRFRQQFSEDQLNQLDLQHVQMIFPAATAIVAAGNAVEKSYEDCKEFGPLLVALSSAIPHSILRQMSKHAIPSLQQFSSLDANLVMLQYNIQLLFEVLNNTSIPHDLALLQPLKECIQANTTGSFFHVLQSLLEEIKLGAAATPLVCEQIVMLFFFKQKLNIQLGKKPELHRFALPSEVSLEQLTIKLAEIQRRVAAIPEICKAISEKLEPYKSQVLIKLEQLIEEHSLSNSGASPLAFRP